MYHWQRHKTNIAVESINTCTACGVGGLQRFEKTQSHDVPEFVVVMAPWGELKR